MPLKGTPGSWESGSKIALIRDALRSDVPHVGGSDKCAECGRAARSMYDLVGSDPLIYRTKVNGVMTPLPKGKERWTRFSNEVREVHAYITAGVFTEDAPKGCGPCDNGLCGDCGDCKCCKPQNVRPIRPVRDDALLADVSARAEAFYTQVQKRRAFVRGRQKMESLDSMRIVIDGVKAICQGVPVEALVSAIEMPWSAETRVHAQNFRPTAQDLKPVQPEGLYDYASFAPRPEAFAHETSAYVATLVKAGIPVWLYGPAGTGKSSAARYAAKVAGLDYYEVNLAGSMVSSIKGKDRLKSFVESDFMRAYRDGGVVCLEEFSAAHPTVGTALNTALAADFYHNDADDTDIGYGPGVVKKHPDFRVVVTDNSLGYGCPIFKRAELDAATRDRFRMGRVYQGLDLTLERNIMRSILESYAMTAARAA